MEWYFIIDQINKNFEDLSKFNLFKKRMKGRTLAFARQMVMTL